MNARGSTSWLVLGIAAIAVFSAQAATVSYTLDNVILDDGNAQMFGTFSWTYDEGDFENGVGQFSELDIPFTSHDHTDLEVAFDIGNSIEITLPGSVHDDGVDITLFLVQPLTPTTGSAVDLSRSQYEIGGNGFHDGVFLSGSIVPTGPTSVEADMVDATLTAYPNPFNPMTTLSYDLQHEARVRIRIHDVAGRIVRTLISDEHHADGRFTVTWRGRDEWGRSVASGVYFARMETGDQALSRKVLLLD